MDWSYIAGFFDGEGNIHIQRIKQRGKIKSHQVVLRFFNNDLVTLTKIREFLGCGRIYINGNRKNKLATHELVILKKEDVRRVLETLQKHCISKLNKISYILQNYRFTRENNLSFNIEEFHGLTDRRNIEKFYIHKNTE